jgi:3-oxoadipate enol-lactonase
MPNLVPRLKEIACPVLGICGKEDPSPDRPDLLAGMAEFQQVWIPESRRFTMVEAPSAFNTALAGFLARVA